VSIASSFLMMALNHVQFGANAVAYGFAVTLSGLLALMLVDRKIRKPTSSSGLLLVCFAMYLAIHSGAPNVFGHRMDVLGSSVQLNGIIIAFIVHVVACSSWRPAAVVAIAVYAMTGVLGPIFGHLHQALRVSAMVLVAGSIYGASHLLRALVARSIELAEKNADLLAELEDANQRLVVLATVDELTGVLNRRGWSAARESMSNHVGLVFVDIDSFKQINDSFGHGVGDNVLREVAEALRAVTRPGDVVARLGGDEFAVLFDAVGPEKLDELQARIREHLTLVGQSASVPWTASIGSSSIASPDLFDQGSLEADANLYATKRVRA
jgi:diguanylate cyclase (GGDEF)-like protein